MRGGRKGEVGGMGMLGNERRGWEEKKEGGTNRGKGSNIRTQEGKIKTHTHTRIERG